MQLVLSVAGNAIAGPVGGMVGALVGGYLDARLFAPDRPDVQGPRLNDLRVGGSAYGTPIPLVYGTYRVGGQLLWATDIVEVAASDDVGGKGGPSYTATSYSYYGNFAVGLCAANPGPAPITGVSQIFADGRLIWEDGNLAASPYNEHIRVHLGGLDQLPDPLIEATEGVGNVSALQHWCYVVFDHLPLADFGNRLPTITAVVRNGDGANTVDTDVLFTSGHIRALNGSQFSTTGEIPDEHGQNYVSTGARVIAFGADGSVIWDLGTGAVESFLTAAGYAWPPGPYAAGPFYTTIAAAPVAGGAYVAVVVSQLYQITSIGVYRAVVVLCRPNAGAAPTPLGSAWCSEGFVRVVYAASEPRIFSLGGKTADDPIVFEAYNAQLSRQMRVFPSPNELLAGYAAGWGATTGGANTAGWAAGEIPTVTWRWRGSANDADLYTYMWNGQGTYNTRHVGTFSLPTTDAQGTPTGATFLHYLNRGWMEHHRADSGGLYKNPETRDVLQPEVVGADPPLIRAVFSPTVTLTAAELTAAGLGPAEPVTVRICQLSSRVGRGTSGEATV